MGGVVFTFKCRSCDETHVGMPTFGADKPLSYFAVPKDERASRCDVGSDDCVIDGDSFFVRGCIDIPVRGASDPFVWGVWVSLSKDSFDAWLGAFGQKERNHVGPFFGWLDAWLKPYPDTVNLKAKVHLRNDGIRPYIELEPTGHPLAVEQRNGISASRVAEIYAIMMHDMTPNTSFERSRDG